MFKKKSKRIQLVRKLGPFIYSHRTVCVFMVLGTLLITIIQLVTPLLYQFFINHVINEKKLVNLIFVVVGYGVLYIFQTIFVAFNTFYKNKFQNLLHVRNKKKVLQIFLKMPMNDFEAYGKGELRNIAEEDTKMVEGFFNDHVLGFGCSVLYILSLNVIMFLLNWRMALFGCIMMLISFGCTGVISKKMKEIANSYRKEIGEFESAIQISLQNWKEIKSNNLLETEMQSITEKWKYISQLIMKRTLYNFFAGALNALNMFVITRVSLYCLGGLLVYRNLLDVATLLVFMNYYERLNGEMKLFTEEIVQFRTIEPQLERVFNMLEKNYPKCKNKRLHGDISLDDVTFRYSKTEALVLRKINLLIKRNSHVALVGSSGSGKSTLAKLLLGLYKMEAGTIRIGEDDIQSVSDSSLHHAISAVMQDPQFFNISILENLRLVKPKVSMSEIEEVCMMANVYEFINNLPEGFDTVIGERGVKLSGGQLQRLAIARTLLTNPDSIIFDESTSAFDSENERAVMDAIDEIAKNKTIITIAHRLATVARTDYLIMLQDGRVQVEGETRELLEHNPDIAGLFRLNVN